VGRTFLAVSFPVLFSAYVAIDGTAGATPLTVQKMYGHEAVVSQYKDSLDWTMLVGNHAGSLGETCALLLIAGGIFLILMKVIDWRIPLFYLGTVAALAAVLGQDAGFQLLAGGLLLGAFFMATDYVTSPMTSSGRILFAVGCGVLTVILRLYSSYPEGVAFSILLMNSASPLIDRLTKPKPFGR
jgi:electron transport complex protein RnfD